MFSFIKSLGSNPTMRKFKVIIVLIWPIIWLIQCAPCRRKNETIKTINRTTGETTAVDDLIQKYEREHQKFYEEKTIDGDYLEWPALDNKDISNYCRKFLQQSVPKRTNIGGTGVKIKKVLHYEKENSSITSNIVIVHCKVKMKYTVSYYITQAPEPNCVYAVKCIRSSSIFKIIHKYCDFEEKPMATMSLKRKMVEGIVSKLHPKTGQPIVKDKYLLEYELEHQEMLKKEGKRGELAYWSQATEHPNLDYYCYEYMRVCVPRRNRDGIIGSWGHDVIHYQKLNKNEDIKVMIVQCKQISASDRYYYLARALELNCVYGLIRHRPNQFAPFVIVFKCCDFEDSNSQ